MPAGDGNDRESILRRRSPRRDAAPGAKPVRLSDLAPPGGLPPPGARPRGSAAAGGPVSAGQGAPGSGPASAPPARPASAGRASSPILPPPRVPPRPPGPAPQRPGSSRAAAPPADGVARLRADLQESEAARRRAEARVAELERELAELRGAVACAASGDGGNGSELERLRRGLEEAHTIIRAIEEAYLAGGGEAAPPAEPPAL